MRMNARQWTLVVALALAAGCATFPDGPKNATLKTSGGPLVQAHRGSRGEYDDFADGGGDSHVRVKGMDHIVITDYRNFANAVKVLTE